MSHIDLLFHAGDHWISQGVMFVSRGPVSHLALVSPDGKTIIESSGLAKPSGVQERPFEEWVAGHPGCFPRKIAHPDPAKVWDVTKAQLGKEYDWLYFLGFFLHQPRLHDRKKVTCSELIYEACLEAGYNIFPPGFEPMYLTPSMLYAISQE
jgi:hypothetical protein